MGIDYTTGESKLDTETTTNAEDDINASQYVLNTSSKKIHKPTCSGAKNMSENNKKTGSVTELKSYLNDGYEYCGNCF